LVDPQRNEASSLGEHGYLSPQFDIGAQESISRQIPCSGAKPGINSLRARLIRSADVEFDPR
jgi:hypothetical protein